MTQESGLFTKQLKTNYQYLYFIKAVLRGGFFRAMVCMIPGKRQKKWRVFVRGWGKWG